MLTSSLYLADKGAGQRQNRMEKRTRTAGFLINFIVRQLMLFCKHIFILDNSAWGGVDCKKMGGDNEIK